MKYSKGLIQAYHVQDLTYDSLMSLRQAITKDNKIVCSREDAQAIGQLVRAWESAQERIRIHRGKPMPGSLRPVKSPSKRGRVLGRVLLSMPESSTESSTDMPSPECAR